MRPRQYSLQLRQEAWRDSNAALEFGYDDSEKPNEEERKCEASF